jgi:hypothetical protein
VVEPGKMNSTFSLLLVFLTRLFMPRHNAQMRLLKAQIHISAGPHPDAKDYPVARRESRTAAHRGGVRA